jgi:hypothetical protein
MIHIQIKAKRNTINKSKYMTSFLKIILLGNIILFLEPRTAQRFEFLLAERIIGVVIDFEKRWAQKRAHLTV